MVCGIKFSYRLYRFDLWCKTVNIKFKRIDNPKVYDKCIVVTYKAKHKKYFLTVKETCDFENKPFQWLLLVAGSCHKNYFKGENYSRFTIDMLHLEIKSVCKALSLKPELCKIQNIEFGVNIFLPYSAIEYIRNNILSFKGKHFADYKNSRGKCIGANCSFIQYIIKVYSKSLQFGLNFHLMRFEIKIKKMQKIGMSGIRFLSDLFNVQLVKDLGLLLLKIWQEILIFERGIDINEMDLNRWNRELVIAGQNKKWKDTFKKGKRFTKKETDRYSEKRARFKTIMQRYGENSQGQILDLIRQECDYLAKVGGNFTVKIKGKVPPHLNTNEMLLTTPAI